MLIYRLGSLGDTVVALPSLHRVAAVFPRAERRLLTNFPVASKAAAASAVLDGSGLVHSYQRYTVGMRNPLQLAALLFSILRWRPQVLVYLAAARGVSATRRDAVFFRLCGVRRIVGLAETQDLQENRQRADGTVEPEAARLARTLASIGSPDVDDPANWSLGITPAEAAAAGEVLLPLAGFPFFVVSLGTKLQVNQWGVENWSALLQSLAQTFPGRALVMIGAGEEHALCEDAAQGWRRLPHAAPVLNLCGALTPRVSAAVCARAEVFLGHDSGPLHLSACMGTPCVGIYSARNPPGMWFPHGPQHRVLFHRVDCTGCGLLTCDEQKKKCILSITVGEVLAAVEGVFRDRQAAGSDAAHSTIRTLGE